MNIWQLLFSFKGRINRKTFWFSYIFSLFILFQFIYMMAFFVAEMSHYLLYVEGVLPKLPLMLHFMSLTLFSLRYLYVEGLPKLLLILLSTSFLLHYICFAITAKRLHDTNQSAWCLLLCVIIPLYEFIVCGFFKGNPNHNTYGDPQSVIAKGLDKK